MSIFHNFYSKHKQLTLYFSFGIITTVVSLAICYLTLKIGELIAGEITGAIDVLGSTTQWLSGVIVAFITNKKWVFTDAERGMHSTATQFLKFSSSRIATYFIEVGINLLGIFVLTEIGYKSFCLFGLEITERVWAKAISSILVVIINYFISKFIVFKKSNKQRT